VNEKLQAAIVPVSTASGSDRVKAVPHTKSPSMRVFVTPQA